MFIDFVGLLVFDCLGLLMFSLFRFVGVGLFVWFKFVVVLGVCFVLL